MTIAIPARVELRGFAIDVSKPVLYGFAAILCVLIVLPLSWLLLYSLTDAKGALTLGNFYRLFSESSFFDPLVTTFIIATSSAFICCAVAAPMGWLVARTDLPFSGLLNKIFRSLTGVEQDVHLFNIYTLEGIIFVISCYTFPYVFVLVANSLDRTPGELEDLSLIHISEPTRPY